MMYIDEHVCHMSRVSTRATLEFDEYIIDVIIMYSNDISLIYRWFRFDIDIISFVFFNIIYISFAAKYNDSQLYWLLWLALAALGDTDL